MRVAPQHAASPTPSPAFATPPMPDPYARSRAPSQRELATFERLLADLSARFINLPAAEVDGAITASLRQIAATLGADRSQLVRFSSTGPEIGVTHSGALPGVVPALAKPIASRYPWAIARIRAGRAVVVPRVTALPAEAATDKASWESVGVRSNLTVPLVVAGRLEGALAIGCLRRERKWPKALVDRVGVLATIFANSLAHKRAQEGLDAAMRFERAVSDLLADLLTAAPAQQDRVIEAGLAEMARAFGAGRATLWQRVGDTEEFAKTHRWLAEGVPVPPEAVGAAATPWVTRELMRGSIVRFASLAGLPPEAAADLPGLRALHVRAAVAVPLEVSGVVVGALAFASSSEDREWPDALVPRIRLLGEVLASTLARKAAERREREAQAQAAHAARVGTMGVFAASLVHELTQPLAASLANAETAAGLLADPSPDLGELRATVGDIVADDRRVGALIQQLRRFLRRGEGERAELALCEVVDEALRFVANEAATHGVEIRIDVPAALPRLVGDRIQLQQVFVNLLGNAVHAVGTRAPGARRITVVARASEGGVGIEVGDSGPGMDEATLARVFQPFFTTKPGGMGLGLSICRSIVAAHGGTLSARSPAGGGTTFRIELPLRPAVQARPAPVAAPPMRGAGTVHLVDDDPSMRRALERQLQSAGHRVESFASAQAYLDHAPAPGAACLVSDVRMPGLSGLDLQATLVRAGRDLPTVFISGHGDIPMSVRAMKAGAVGFLSKPFTRGELLAAVDEALARSREQARARQSRAELQSRYDSLTPREREVLALVASGLLNKVAADRLGIAEKTVKVHRGRVMEKMGAGSVAELVRLVERLAPLPAAAAPVG
jgi:FixJ family two-component response regulator/signal transduction histidine kinase